MNLKAKLIFYGVALVVVLGWLWFRLHKHDVKVDRNITSTVLPPTDTEKLIIDPTHHTIEILNRTSTGATQVQKRYLNPRGDTAIEEKTNGSVLVTQRTYGTEGRGFAGVAIGSDVRLRGAVGLNVVYVHSFDLGAGLLFSSDIKDTRLMADVSYNFYDNLSVGLYVDHKKDVGVVASIRF